jgi:dihydroxyacid dehydratase/phosphogluconate dehydratase
MFDSLPYRNDAAIVFRRLIRSLPTRRAVIGVATCDKGLPATMIALASMHDLPVILVPGGATLPPTFGEDAGKVQTIGARYANNELSLKEASELGCRACAPRRRLPVPRHRGHLAGGGRSVRAGAAALGARAIGPGRLAGIARQSARAVMALDEKGITARDILTDKAIENAMVVHAPLAAPPTCCCISPPSPMRPNAVCRTWRSGAPSTAKCRAW